MAGLPLCLFSQSKIDLAGVELLSTQRARIAAQSAGTQEPMMISAIIVPENDDCAAVLENEGLTITDLGVTILTEIPLDKVEQIAQLPEVKHITLEKEMKAMMDFARPACYVTDAQEGFTFNEEQHSYDGSGVVVSLFDTGIDVNHINFKDADGNSRVKRAWIYKNTSTPTEYKPDSRFNSIDKATTDNANQTHGTHVAGIMGGSYKGAGKYSTVNSASGTRQENVEGNIPFYGVATGSDLAFAGGPLTNANIINGVTRIIEYAESQNQPVVVNLSLGSTVGPHDGTDSYSQSLAALGKRGIICIAAGNDGNNNMSICREVSKDNPIRTMFSDNTCKGIFEVWGEDDKPLRVGIGLLKIGTNELTELGSVNDAGQSFAISANSNGAFANSYKGSISVRSDLNNLNNRFNVYFNCSFEPSGTNPTERVVFFVESENDSKAYVYGDSNVSFNSFGMAGYEDGSPDNSINDSACAENLISIGSYTTRTSWGVLGYGPYSYNGGQGLTVGRISGFSSYGKNFKGEQLPMVAAPGAGIVSSYSRYYTRQLSGDSRMTAKVEDADGEVYYWANDQGTSMACPYVTGVVGMWLQACPTLTFEQVLEVIKKSSTYNSLSMKDGRWGAGKINATAGLKYILTNYAAIGSVWEDDAQRLIVSGNGDFYDVTLAGEASFKVGVVDLQGRTVATADGRDGSATVDVSSLTKGVYVLTIQGASTHLSRKIAVK